MLPVRLDLHELPKTNMSTQALKKGPKCEQCEQDDNTKLLSSLSSADVEI